MAIPGDEAIEKITYDRRDNRQEAEESPSSAKVLQDTKDGRGSQVMPAGFRINYCIELILRQTGFMQHLPALLRLQSNVTKQVSPVALPDETYLAVAELAFAVV